MSRVVVIGAGAMGLAAAYRAAKNGHSVDLIEGSTEPGGMAGHFDFSGLSLERFYHFCCKSDHPTFELLDELGMPDKMRWVATTMGLFIDGKLYPWGNPVALLTFPRLSLIDRIRYGIFAFICVRRDEWEAIESEPATSWLLRWCGQSVFDRLWKPLFQYKFYEYAGNVSSTWIWTRIRRIGRSRKSLMEESLGYIEGGTLTLVNALVAAIQQHGGRVHLGEPAVQVISGNGSVTGVQTDQRFFPADQVISTAPTPYISALIPDLPADWKAKYDAIHNIGCICVIYKLKKAVTPHFWVNISEPGLEIPGIIEFSNLRPFGDEHVVYVPYYMPTTHEKFSWPDEKLLAEALDCLQRINPSLTPADVLDTKVARLRYAQPVCEPDFLKKLPAVETPIGGLQVADTCYYYPEDRGIAESIRLGLKMAEKFGMVSATESAIADAALTGRR